MSTHERARRKAAREQELAEKKRPQQEHEDQVKKLMWENEELQKKIKEQMTVNVSHPPEQMTVIASHNEQDVQNSSLMTPTGQRIQDNSDIMRNQQFDPPRHLPLREVPPPPSGTQTARTEQQDNNGGHTTQQVKETQPLYKDDGHKLKIVSDRSQMRRALEEQLKKLDEEESATSEVNVTDDLRKKIVEDLMAALAARAN